MRIERTNNAIRNTVFGVVLKIYQILVPFLMRSVMIYLMGVEYLGLNSLFTSILQVLNLAELGVGSAMVFSMYKPIVEDDVKKICALERLYMIYYRYIGLAIAIVGICLMPFLPRLIKGKIPDGLNVYLLYGFNLGATVLTYWFFAYKNSIFQAHQRNDILAKITLLTNTIQYIIQVVVLWCFRNYYYYIIAMLISNVLNNILVAVSAKRIYPQYVARGKLSKVEIHQINRRIKDLFTAKLGSTIVNSADTIVISAFLGLTALAMYQNYYFIMTAVMGGIQVFIYACLAGIGNSMITESLDKNYDDFKKLVFIINWITTVCVVCFACLYQPFIELWVGKQYLFDFKMVILMCIYFYFVIMQQVIGLYKDAAGIWHQDRYRPLVASVINLLCNVILVQFWGIYAIVFSTILSYLLVAIPWIIKNVFQYVFKRSAFEYINISIQNIFFCGVITFVCFILCNVITNTNSYVTLIVKGLGCVCSSNVMLWVVYRNDKYYNDMIDYFNRFTKKKFNVFWGMLKTKEKRYDKNY